MPAFSTSAATIPVIRKVSVTTTSDLSSRTDARPQPKSISLPSTLEHNRATRHLGHRDRPPHDQRPVRVTETAAHHAVHGSPHPAVSRTASRVALSRHPAIGGSACREHRDIRNAARVLRSQLCRQVPQDAKEDGHLLWPDQPPPLRLGLLN